MTVPSHSAHSDDISVDDRARALWPERVDILFRMGRLYLFLPFSALCIAAAFYSHACPEWLAIVPLLLQIGATVATREFAERYERRDRSEEPRDWARRYVWYSAASGAAWGVGAVVWYVPDSFPAEGFLALAFMGMTAAEFIARAVYRPAYSAHAFFSLSPLIVLLAMEGNMYAGLAAILVLFFGGVLYGYCDNIGEILNEGIRLRRENADLVIGLSVEKEAAEKARDVAETGTRAKSAFIANISHEIRTPLNALLGMAQLLEQSELDNKQRSHVKILLEAGRGLKVLLDDVIALARDEAEPAALNEDECDVGQAARTVMRMLQPRAWEKKIYLTVSAPNNLPRAAADPRRVRQVLLKLADNAVKFTERGGVEIRVETLDAEHPVIRFSVTDTGLGFAPEIAANLFKPFTPGDSSYSRKADGAGLGLAVAKRNVESFGGEIGFKSAPGEGATFWFTAPAVHAAVVDRFESAAIASDAPPPANLGFLIATADETVRRTFIDFLEPFGNKLTMADTLSEAVARAGRENFDCIIAAAADTDTLAAAPGVRAPVMALVSGGMRSPEGAAAILRWPASAAMLYAGLRDALGGLVEEQEVVSPDDAVAAIDASAFASLEKSLGMTTLIEILQSYMITAEELCTHLDQASEDENWEDAARVAQDIAGAAGGLGLAALTAAARGFTQKARNGGDGLHDAAQSVVGEHKRVCSALAHLYPDLAA
jgi:signal transduction histidine kinase/HPt (histidine-containing phosphotransfer) domain-containing protein